MKNRPKRSEVPIEQTWDLTPLYPTTANWQADAERVGADLRSLAAYRGRLAAGSVLYECLVAVDAVQERFLKVSRYASNNHAVDGDNPEVQARYSQARAMGAKVAAALAFIQSEVLSIEDAAFAALFAAEPQLEEYRQYLEMMRLTRAHRFAPETEEVLAALGQAFNAPSVIHGAVTSSDMKFPSVADEDGDVVTMSVARYARLAQSQNRDVRRRAYDSLTEGMDRHKSGLATSLASYINTRVTDARLRRYGSALESTLSQVQVPVEVYNNVLDTIMAEAAPHVQRYMRLRQRVLGLDRVYRYDMTAPLDPDYDATTTWEQGTRTIQAGLAVLGPEYGAMLSRAFSERWVDRADNEGKQHGAFNSGIYGWHPVVMMTWQDKARDMFTLAHELGHSGHRFLSSQNQNFANSGMVNVGRFFLEAPSTANEAILGDYLLARTTDVRQRRYIIESFLGTFMHNMVTHLLEAALERELFNLAETGKPVTLKAVLTAQGDVMERFFGGSVVVDDGARLTWTTVPHFYMDFYPLVYAAGLSAGCAVAEAIRTEGQPAVDRWIATLKAGSTKQPLDLYKMAGVDMSKPDPIRSAVGLFGRLVADLEACYA